MLMGKTKAAGKEKKRVPVYWVCLGVYVLVLLFLSWMFLAYTDRSLIQYENAQSEHAMANYLTDFQGMVTDRTLTDHMDMPAAPGEFESADVYKDLYYAQLEGVSSYTFEKDTDSYLTEEPVYDIFADGTMVARVTFSAYNERTIFGILTIMDWEVREIEPVFDIVSNEYTIRIPDCYTATVNGVALSEKHLTGNTVENPEYVNVSNYVKMPVLVEYKVTGLVHNPDIRVYDTTGAEVLTTPDADGNIAVDYQDALDEMPEEYYNDALKMAQAWENFLTGDLGGANNGLATVQKYLIKDSYYWEIARSYAHGEDITFISAHTIGNPPYSNIEVTDYVSYGENCYSCHIYFEKNMILKSGASRVDTINSTFYFVKYDDSDDGVDNPHWAIVDMIATTNEGN